MIEYDTVTNDAVFGRVNTKVHQLTMTQRHYLLGLLVGSVYRIAPASLEAMVDEAGKQP